MCSNTLCSPTVFRKAAEPRVPHLTGAEISSSVKQVQGYFSLGNTWSYSNIKDCCCSLNSHQV